MNTAQEARQWFTRTVQEGSDQLPGQTLEWLRNIRGSAGQAVETLPVPFRMQEQWRYTSIAPLVSRHFTPSTHDFTGLQEIDLEDLQLPEMDAYRLVFANGRFIPQLSGLSALPDGVRMGSLRTALSTDPERLSAWFGQTVGQEQDIFTALNTALINDGMLVYLEKGIRLDKPVHIIHVSLELNEPVIVNARNLIVMDEGSGASVIETFVSTGDSVYFNNQVTEILLHAESKLEHVRLQKESRQASHLSNVFISQQQNSQYHGTALAMGAAWARTNYNVRFREEGGVCNLHGLYTAGDQQLIDFHVDVQHAVPNCSSRENFKGLLYGKGRAVFDGRIVVEKQAQKTDAHLSNSNLMLTRNAEVDTKPQLEIHADDVKCSHGTTVGQLDAEQIFYLRSRGIDYASAQKMLCLGFAEEILDGIQQEPFRAYASRGLQELLSTAVHDTGSTGA